MQLPPALPWGVAIVDENNASGGGEDAVGGGVGGKRERECAAEDGDETPAGGAVRQRTEGERTSEEDEGRKQRVPEVKVGDRVEVLWDLDDEPIWWPATVEQYRDGRQTHESRRIWNLNYDEHEEFPSETMRVCFLNGDEMKTVDSGAAAPATADEVAAEAKQEEGKGEEEREEGEEGDAEDKGDATMHWRFENTFTLGEYAQKFEDEVSELRASGVDVPNVEDELKALPAAVAARVADGMRQFKDALADSIRRRYDASMLERENEVTALDAKAIIADVFSSIGAKPPTKPAQ